MTIPPSIVDFLNARYDEHERTANEARRMGCSWTAPGPCDAEPLADDADLPGCDCPSRRALLALEAKRRIMALHVLNEAEVVDADGVEHPGRECVTCFAEDWPCLTLRLLTLEFQNHRDYRTDWVEAIES